VVSDSRSGDIALLDDDLKLVSWLGREFERPTGVACRGDQIYVAETGKHRILIIDADGTVTTIGERGHELGQFNFPAAITIAGDTLWVGDTLNFRIQRISISSGRALSAFGQLGDASGETPRIKGIAVDRDGNLWVSDALLDQVSLYNRSGEFLMGLGESGAGPGQLSFPTGVSAHSDGRMAIVDSLNRRVQIFRLIDTGQEGD
jgi:sugar lactone lactonase YvrE